MSAFHHLHEADCFGEHGIQTLADDSIDVCITDPPFEAEAHGQGRRLRYDECGRQIVEDNPLPFHPITEAQRVACGLLLGNIVKRWVLVFCQVEASHLWRDSLERGGLDYVRTMVWTKPDAQPQYSGDRPGVGYESIVVAHRPGRKRWNGGGRVGVFSHTRERGPNGTGAPHPTTKPLPLMRELVELFTEPGEVVLDPFAGSGSTGVACRELGRSFVGWEVDPTYAAIARRRIAGDEARPRPEQPSLF